MELEEMEAAHAKVGAETCEPDWVDAEEAGEEEQALIDIREAISLFATVKTALDYVANPTLCRVISKRERDTLEKVSEQVRTFLAAVEPTYMEGDFE